MSEDCAVGVASCSGRGDNGVEPFQRWESLQFPEAGLSDCLGDAQDDLTHFDAEIAFIVRNVDARDRAGPVGDVLADLDDIIARVTAHPPADNDEANVRRWQLAYATA